MPDFRQRVVSYTVGCFLCVFVFDRLCSVHLLRNAVFENKFVFHSNGCVSGGGRGVECVCAYVCVCVCVCMCVLPSLDV